MQFPQIPLWSQFVGLIENILVQLALFTGNGGWAIVLLTIIIKLLLVPLTLSSLRSAKRMQELQPKLKEVQKKYSGDRQMVSAETMKLYQEHKVNPLGSCLPMLIQMPIFFGLYYAIINISGHPPAGFVNQFFWINDLSKPASPVFLLPVIVTATQFIQQRMALPPKTPGQQLDSQQQMMNSMMQFMPLMVGFFAWSFASGPVLYWITQNIFSAIQQFFITGFGSLRNLPGLDWLPVPPWAVQSVASVGDSKVIVTKSRPADSQPQSSATVEPSGLLGQLYKQINRRVEEVERQRTTQPDQGSAPPSGEGARNNSTRPAAAGSSRRAARRSRNRR